MLNNEIGAISAILLKTWIINTGIFYNRYKKMVGRDFCEYIGLMHDNCELLIVNYLN